jgi:hypothetical protein
MPTRLMSASEVFDVLVQHHTGLVEDGFTKEGTITPDTTVHDWFSSPDESLRPWVGRAKALNDAFRLNVSLKTWKPVLNPARHRDLASVCAFIAERARVPEITNLRILGRECRTAGAFTTLRSMIEDCGVDVSEVHPSAPLCRYESTAWPKIAHALFLMAPSSLRFTWSSSRAYWSLFVVAIAFLIAAFVGVLLIFTDDRWMIGAPMAAASYGGSLLVRRWLDVLVDNPHRIEIVGLSTFADLSRVLAGSATAED